MKQNSRVSVTALQRALRDKTREAEILHRVSETVSGNLGFSKPKRDPGHYPAKIEYWALLWGTFIMVATGAMLVYENFMMKHFPKWLLDVAATVHFYEAVLATLAIVVWHGYFTMLDPDHYPMNWSMFSRRRKPEKRRAL